LPSEDDALGFADKIIEKRAVLKPLMKVVYYI